MFLMLLYLSMVITSSITMGQNIPHLPLWTDVYLRGAVDFQDIDFTLEFLMDTYKVISLEKCLHQEGWGSDTEEVFQNLTARMRSLRPNSDAQILYYWSLDSAFDCYKSINTLKDRPELWLRDADGYPIIMGGHNLPFYDFRIVEAANLWISGAFEQVKLSEGRSQGVFLDGVHRSHLAQCHFKTCGEDGASCCQVSIEEEEEYHQAKGEAVEELRRQLHELKKTNVVLGNGVMNYNFYPGNGNPTFDFFLDKLDGFCMEHIMAFEDLNLHATEQPFINIVGLENLIQIRNSLVNANKTLLVRGYPGPVTQPINHIGSLVGPHLHPNHSYPQPETNIEMQQAMKDLVYFPLAVFLCAFAGPNVYFSYSLWYNIRQSVPCRLNPEDCHFPADFDTLLDMNPGDPVTEPSWSDNTCTRWFKNFGVSVNLEDEHSATWIPI